MCLYILYLNSYEEKTICDLLKILSIVTKDCEMYTSKYLSDV